MDQNDVRQRQEPTLIEAYEDEIEVKSLATLSSASSESDSDSSDEEGSCCQEKERAKLGEENSRNHGPHVRNFLVRNSLTAQREISPKPPPYKSEIDIDGEHGSYDVKEKQPLSLSVSSISQGTNSFAFSDTAPKLSSFQIDHEDKMPHCNQERKRNTRVVDHTYRDLSRIPADMKYDDLLENPQGEFSFLIKLHAILNKYSKYVGWLPHGRSFRVIVPKRFETHVLPEFSKVQNRRHTFIKHLINWGFKHIIKGPDRNSYYHEVSPFRYVLSSIISFIIPQILSILNTLYSLQAFLQDLPHLVIFMKFKIRTKPFPDPENEPCFYKIHQISPLPRFASQEASFQKDAPKSSETLSCSTISTSSQTLAQHGTSYSKRNIEHEGKLPAETLKTDFETSMIHSSAYTNQEQRSAQSKEAQSSSTHATSTQSLDQTGFAYARSNIEHLRQIPQNHLNSNFEVAMMNSGAMLFNTRYSASTVAHPRSNYKCETSLDAMKQFLVEANGMNEEELKQSLLINRIQQQQILQSSCNAYHNYLRQGPPRL